MKSFTADEFIFSMDGVSTFGDSEIRLSKTRAIIINSRRTAEHSYLRHVARSTGGMYLNLAEMSNRSALAAMKSRPYLFLGATYDTNAIEEVYSPGPERLRGDFTLTGLLKKDRARITLRFGFPKGRVHTESIVLKKTDSGASGTLLRRVWARKKLAFLNLRPRFHEREIVKMGKEYGFVTRYTSLIVLERLRTSQNSSAGRVARRLSCRAPQKTPAQTQTSLEPHGNAGAQVRAHEEVVGEDLSHGQTAPTHP